MRDDSLLRRVQRVVRRGGGRATTCPLCFKPIRASQRTVMLRGVPVHRSCVFSGDDRSKM